MLELTFYLGVEVIHNNLELSNIHVCENLSAHPSLIGEWKTNLRDNQKLTQKIKIES